MNIEHQLLDLLLNQQGDYRLWEEAFFTACRDYLEQEDDWNNLLLSSRVYSAVVQAKAEYLVHVFELITGIHGFDGDKLLMQGCAPLNTSLWDRDFFPDFDYQQDKLALRFGLQRGMMIDRFYQFLITGSN
ncbi:MAG: hypothetical protein R3341_07260 [Methylophaga sp.]|nr:hypothetical protein [Methylophaga sp.]